MITEIPDLLNPKPSNLAPSVTATDTLIRQINRQLTPTPIGSYYKPSSMVSPDRSIAGGHVPMSRRYQILVDKILIPYKLEGQARVGQDGYLEGIVSEADLIAAGCNIQYLVDMGHIVEAGFFAV